MVTPLVSIKYQYMYQFSYLKVSSTNHNGNLLMLDDPGCVRGQITSVVYQMQWFDFDCNQVVTQKVRISSGEILRSKPLHMY